MSFNKQISTLPSSALFFTGTESASASTTPSKKKVRTCIFRRRNHCSFSDRFEGILCPPLKRPRQGQRKLNLTSVHKLNVCFNKYIYFKTVNLDIRANYHQFGRWHRSISDREHNWASPY